MKGFLSIREFSEISGVPITSLRYWDDNGLFSPTKRDPNNNYRCYTLDQIVALNFITTLSDMGVSLKTIAEFRQKRDAQNLLHLLDQEQRELDTEFRVLRERLSMLHVRRELIQYGLTVDETQISVVNRENDRAAILWPRNRYEEGDTFLEPLTALINKVVKYRINMGFPIGGRYDNMATFLEAPSCPQHFFSLDPSGKNSRKKGKYLVGFTRGAYGELGDLPERMSAYAKENNLKLSGHVYLTYPLDEICIKDPSQYLAQAMVAVSKSRRHS